MSDTDAREISRLWRVYKTIHEMVNDRVSDIFFLSNNNYKQENKK